MTVEATYEDGVLKLDEPVPFPEGARVRVSVEFSEPGEHPGAGRSPVEILAEIAALSNPVKPGEENVAAEHDKYLYGWDKY